MQVKKLNLNRMALEKNLNDDIPVDAHSHWNKILSIRDPKLLWKSINWKGTFDTPNANSEKPSDYQFCEHYRRSLSNANTEAQYEPLQEKFIPVLDKDISPDENDFQLRKLKPIKQQGTMD